MLYTYPTSFTSNTYFKISGFEKRLFSRLGIEPYLPLKSEIVQGLKQENYEGIYKLLNYAMPYDIEREHLIKNRDKIRSIPLEFTWSDSERNEYNKLPTFELKRRMILDKVDMKSIYMPNLKYEKDFIPFPPLPTGAKAKESFTKGFALYNNRDKDSIEASIPLLEDSASAGNYIAHEILGRYYLSVMRNCENQEDVVWERANKSFFNHCNWLCKANLPVGYHLMSKYYEYYRSTFRSILSSEDRNIMWERDVENSLKAIELGSYDEIWPLAVNTYDLEWVLCLMILTGNPKALKPICRRLLVNHDNQIADPRRMAILKLAYMLGSEAAYDDCIQKPSSFCGAHAYPFYRERKRDHDEFDELYSTSMLWDLLEDSPDRFYGYDGPDYDEEKEVALKPFIDDVVPPSTVWYSPYGALASYCKEQEVDYMDYTNELYEDLTPLPGMEHDGCFSINYPYDEVEAIYKSYPYKDPRSKDMTIENQIAVREKMAEFDYKNSIEYKDANGKFYNIDDVYNFSKSPKFLEDALEYFGYCNALKKRELEMNPYYYKLARPYIFPEEVYKKHPDWY